MKIAAPALLALLSLSAIPGQAAQHLIPAGSLIQCTISEGKINSKTTAVGDPVLCRTGRNELYGRSQLPAGSYLVGRFEEYKDPGHFVGKGWMELTFDRMLVEPDTMIPVEVRVVDVPGYAVDQKGRILGKGHRVRDIVTWSIPILWPIDLAMLPARGPRPTLKGETKITLKVMDDLTVPAVNPPAQDSYGLTHRSAIDAAPPVQEAPAEPQMSYAPEPAQPEPVYAPEPESAQQYAQPAPYPVYAAPPPPAVVYYPAPAPVYYPAPVVVPRVYVSYGYGYGYGGGYARPMAPRAYAPIPVRPAMALRAGYGFRR